MTSSEIEQLSRNLSNLQNYSQIDLDQLALNYPNVQAFHVFKAYLAKVSEDSKEQKLLSKAAIYSTDRNRLFELLNDQIDLEAINQSNEESISILEEINQLDPLTNISTYQLEDTIEESIEDDLEENLEIKQELAANEALPHFAEVAKELKALSDNAEKKKEEIRDNQLEQNLHDVHNISNDEVLKDHDEIEIENDDEVINHLIDEHENVIKENKTIEDNQESSIETNPSLNKPNKKAKSFGSWIHQFNENKIEESKQQAIEKQEEKLEGPMDNKDNIDTPIKIAVPTEQKDQEMFASFRKDKISSDKKNEHFGMVTETLAKILEKQGNIEKAIEIYEQLSLQDPKKITYFADLINNLKTKL